MRDLSVNRRMVCLAVSVALCLLLITKSLFPLQPFTAVLSVSLLLAVLGVGRGYLRDRQKEEIVRVLEPTADSELPTEQDLQESSQKISDKPGPSKYDHLVENINIGVFRTTVGKNGRFIEANPACITILGLTSEAELFSVPAWDLFLDSKERNIFLKKFSEDGAIHRYPLRLHHQDGRLATVSISAVLVRDDAGRPVYCDGLLEDVTDSIDFEEEQKKLIDELQAAQLFLNSPVSRAASEKIVSCGFETTVSKAARMMREGDSAAVLIHPEGQDDYVGIVTDNDMRNRVAAENHSGDIKVSSIMSAPLVWIGEDALMFEALLMILEKNIDHIVVKDIAGSVTKVISATQFLKNQKYPLALLLRDINKAGSPEQLLRIRERLPLIVEASYSSNPDPQGVTKVISAIADAVTRKCLSLAMAEMGAPPCNFAFISLGSVGREEQTLVTDQDNAIIYEDPSPGYEPAADKYFLELGNRVCHWLDRIGYSFCNGEIMAMNGKWCRPLSAWKEYFTQWVSTSEPADLLETKIFFDFKLVDGNAELVNELRAHMHEMVGKKPMFLYHLTQNCLNFKPPLGIFKNIVVETSGEHRDKFSTKRAMTPVVDLARIYALKYQISETGTIPRLKRLESLGHIAVSEYRELRTAYLYLLDLRIKYQVEALEKGVRPDNHVSPKELTEIDQAALREVLSQISSFQTKMSFDFTGSA